MKYLAFLSLHSSFSLIVASSNSLSDEAQSFDFNTRVKHNLSTDEVSRDFCDPNTPISFAGYFGGELLHITLLHNLTSV